MRSDLVARLTEPEPPAEQAERPRGPRFLSKSRHEVDSKAGAAAYDELRRQAQEALTHRPPLPRKDPT